MQGALFRVNGSTLASDHGRLKAQHADPLHEEEETAWI